MTTDNTNTEIKMPRLQTIIPGNFQHFHRHHPRFTGHSCVTACTQPGASPRRALPTTPIRTASPQLFQVKSMYIYIHPSHQSCMKIIRAPTIARAHELAVKMVLEKGWALNTEDDEATIEYEELALDIEDPFAEPMASPCSRFQRRFLETYADNLLNGSEAEFEYDYHHRLFDWGERLSIDGVNVHVDQIDYIIQKLKASPESRRAVAVTWNPVVDESLDDCPCLQLVQCLLRDGRLQMKVVFRSNDMLSASGANMYALVHLQKRIADEVGAACGRYTHIALVPHVYYKRDLNDITPFCKKGLEIQPVPEVCAACGRCDRAPPR